MKKITAILVIFIFVGQALSAEIKFGEIKPSAGFAVLTDIGFGNGKITVSPAQTRVQQLQNFNFGVGLFVDITYAEIYTGCTYGILNKVNNNYGKVTNDKFGTALEFGFSILGKYPIELKTVTLFPMLGLNYNTFMLAWDLKKPLIAGIVKTFSQFGIQAGAGFDYDITNMIYFRLEGLLQIRFMGKTMKEYLNMKGVEGGGKPIPFPGIGPVIKAGVGFRF
jgi:hypothetical protein